jgi:aldo/keto reductase family protein
MITLLDIEKCELIEGPLESRIIARPIFDPRNSTSARLMKEIDESLRRLQTGYIDIYQVHWPDPLVPIEETATAMDELYKQGKIRAIGVSNYSLEQINVFRRLAPLHTAQPPYKSDPKFQPPRYAQYLKAVDEIVRESVTDPVGPEFMAPPAQSEKNREKVMQYSP